MNLEGARNGRESGMYTTIWSGPRTSVGAMNGRYGRLGRTTLIALDTRGAREDEVDGRVPKLLVGCLNLL